ncbi:MAG: hypothetical protein ACK5IJ_06420 [Mangrovibacterium sp.]
MKKVILVFAIVAGFSTISMAQRGSGTRPSQSSEYQQRGPRMSSEERTAKQVERMTTELELTADQQTKVKEILNAQSVEMQNQMKAMREKFGDDPEAMREQMEANRETMHAQMDEQRKKNDAKIKAVLTDAQKVKYDEMQKEMKSRMPGGERPEINHPDE